MEPFYLLRELAKPPDPKPPPPQTAKDFKTFPWTASLMPGLQIPHAILSARYLPHADFTHWRICSLLISYFLNTFIT